MAYDTLTLKNPNSGEIRRAPVGLSWTTFCFNCIPAFMRSDWKWGLIILFTFYLGSIVGFFIYNKNSIKDLIYQKGFKVVSCDSGNLQRISNDLGIELPKIKA